MFRRYRKRRRKQTKQLRRSFAVVLSSNKHGQPISVFGAAGSNDYCGVAAPHCSLPTQALAQLPPVHDRLCGRGPSLDIHEPLGRQPPCFSPRIDWCYGAVSQALFVPSGQPSRGERTQSGIRESLTTVHVRSKSQTISTWREIGARPRPRRHDQQLFDTNHTAL